jgi:Lon protease-like protein
MTGSFDISFEELPEELPLFPLPRVILMPRVQLPLNIFEPRYLAMTRAALGGDSRLIGIVQQRPGGGEVFRTGCAGRITSFEETDDGRYLIKLTGVCRFGMSGEESLSKGGFRVVRPDWARYRTDLGLESAPSGLCRDALMATLRAYFDKRGMMCDKWEEMRGIACERLISTLSVVLPFDAAEKQALLEARTLEDRARLLQCLLENAIKEEAEEKAPCCH